jgi:branched-chain amino acid transport system substrate-binding protein
MSALRRSWRTAVAALIVLMLPVTACGDDSSGGSGSGGSADVDVQQLLGPANRASGESVRLGMVSDGATQAFDNTDELRAAEATAEYWNEHRGGVGGRPIEVVTCETGADPAGATDCANQFVEEGVVAVALSQSAVAESVWEPLHDAGIPTMFFQAFGEGLLADEQSTFVVVSPLSTLFGLPISVAETEEADKIAFVIIDVPQAVSLLDEGAGPDILDRSGIDHDVVRIPPGTADMTSQMQDVADSGAGVVHVIGNDAFCIAAFNGLRAVGYDGAITSISQCITDATREGVPGETLDGMYLTATLALGATDDPTYQLYQAVMSAYGDDVRDVVNNNAMGGYVAMGALATSLQGITGDITPQTVTDTIRAMPEQDLPGGGGVTFQCGRSAVAGQPAVCSTEWLRTQLDAEGQPTTYEAIDSTDLLSSP